MTLPALIEVNLGTEEEPLIVPVAFYAVTSIAVIGLYLAFAIPIWLRWRMGDEFEVGLLEQRREVQVDEPHRRRRDRHRLAVPDDAVRARRLPFSDDFAWKFVNYAPIVTLGALLLLTIWWNVSAKNWFTGPKHTIDQEVVKVFDEG